MKIAIDAMGGDNAPKEIVLGVMRAIAQFKDLEVLLFGDEKQILEFLTDKTRVEIIHTDEKIESDDEPVRAVKRKKNSSMVLAAQAVKDGLADACISAGNTGALMSTGLFVIGRIKGIDRPALAPTLPTISGKGFVMLDLGANSEAKPEHLLQFGLMGSVYAENVRKIERPRIGLLNIGTEETKGNELTKKAFALMKEQTAYNFIGNIEARDLLMDVADVVVTDGFTGNMVLKSLEGTGAAFFSMLKMSLMNGFKNKLAAGVLKKDLLELKAKMDYSEYGGACLFGVSAPVIKAHGSSNAHGIFTTIRQARDMVQKDMVGTIKAEIDKGNLGGSES
ncbi:phosphate acyltransferase [Listeria fleischmannii 1991]|uniref:Phosphate acyltransferase n=2 Tax=Listeria fleischmannii TaxID=1069827 RepID=A0A2X3HE38_9LIST|nr:phosphate acyltransferase PlsX [Listeria fleischmannii]EMG27281.1 phosphate acyltransferase [Listeria fleischmannii subsp. fleischmannii LU2006-1]KMT58799.1 phosphate acyltransferase [Listeria fleischmannii 1991]SQC70541.1 Phosphate acyltransferase [Listeria fleischmannii subsp. fleischmannii]